MVLTASTDFSLPLQAYDTRYDQKSTENLRKFLKCEQHVVLTVNVMHLGDPQHDPNLRGHIGTHPETLRGVVQSKHSMEVLSNVLKEAITLKTMGEKVAVLAYCKRNRHRSVACGWLIASALQELLDEHFGRAELRHLNSSTSWRVMNGMCRGTCATPDAQQQAAQCVDELVNLVRNGKSKGEGINQTFYVLHPARQETVTVSSTTCASTTPPLRSSRSTSTVALKPAPWKQAVETAGRIGEDLLKQQQEREEAMKESVKKAPEARPSRKKEDVDKKEVVNVKKEEDKKEPEKKVEHEKKEDKDKFKDLPRPPAVPRRQVTEKRSRSRTTSRERRWERQLEGIQDVVEQLQSALEKRSRGRTRSRSDSRRRGRRSRTPPRAMRSERRSRSWSPNLPSDSRGYRHNDYQDRQGRGGFEDYHRDHRGRHEWSDWHDNRAYTRSRSQWEKKPRSPEPLRGGMQLWHRRIWQLLDGRPICHFLSPAVTPPRHGIAVSMSSGFHQRIAT